MLRLKNIIPILLLIFCSTRLSAQVIDARISDSTTRFPITSYVSYLQTREQVSIDSAIRLSSAFKKSDNPTVLVFNYDPYYYWFRIIFNNPEAVNKDLMLLMAPVGIYDGQLFQQVNGKWQDVAHTGLKYPFRERAYQFTHHVFPFKLRPNAVDTLYVSINASNAYKSFGFALLQPKELSIFASKIYFVFGIIEGLLILFFILNLALFFALKQWLHIWYALYISLLFLIVLKNDHLEQQFLGMDSELAFRLTPYMTIGALAITVLMHVAQLFLKSRLIENKLLYRLTTWLKINVLLSAIAHAFVFNLNHDYVIHSIFFSWPKISVFLGVLMIIIDCMYCVRRGFTGAIFMLGGSLVFMIGSLQRLFFPSTLSFLFPPTTFHIGIMLETMIISVALVYRYWSEKEAERKSEEQIRAQTLNNISEEIHDNIGQTLALANLNLRTINFTDERSITQKTNHTKELISKAIAELRDLSRTMKSESSSRIDIIEQIKNECSEISRPGVFALKFESNVSALGIDHKKQLIIMRIIKGIFQNIIKHSQAANVGVRLFVTPGILSIRINDDGIGFDASGEKLTSNGLTNIRNRCTLLHATYTITSEEMAGTLVSMEIPV